MYWRRWRRIVTTANVELTNLSVVYGGVTTLIRPMTFVTRHWMTTETTEGTVALISLHGDIFDALTGMSQTYASFYNLYKFSYFVTANLSPSSVRVKPRWGFLTFSLNGWKWLVQILYAYYTFPSTLDNKFLSNYLQLWRSYPLLSATTQRAFRPMVDILSIWWRSETVEDSSSKWRFSAAAILAILDKKFSKTGSASEVIRHAGAI